MKECDFYFQSTVWSKHFDENATQTLVGKNEFLAFASATLEISI